MKNALIKLHIAVFLWGFTGVLGRLISLNEGLLVWYRLLITIVALYFIIRVKNQFDSVSRKQRKQLFAIGTIIALHWCFFYGSIKYSNVSIALTCLSSAGLFTALLEPLITGKKLIGVEILLGLVGIAGIYLIFHFDPQFKTGIILGVICTVLSCIFSILNKSQVSYTAPKTVMLYELTGGFFIPYTFDAVILLSAAPNTYSSNKNGYHLAGDHERYLHNTRDGLVVTGSKKSIRIYTKPHAKPRAGIWYNTRLCCL
jgi:drug/metabolite transporter (DMT)-like permease